MYDKLLISTKVKKTIDYVEKITDNFPKIEYVLKNNLIDYCYELLELTYKANIYQEKKYMKEILIKIRMIEFFTKKSLDKKIINFRKYENIGNHLLEINNMVNSWIMNEKIK